MSKPFPLARPRNLGQTLGEVVGYEQYVASWHRAAAVSELEPEGLGHQVIADGLELAVFRWRGRVYAVENLCPHLGFPLSEGIVREGEVICSWHGWHIRLEDGSCRNERERAKTYPCEIRGDDVWIEV